MDANENTAQPQSATNRVAQELRELIIQGKLPPGNKLKVESLKSTLNTGASPIREALSLLTSDQLVERIDQRGFRVAPVSNEHFQEILMLRCQLEDIALRASIEHGDALWEEGLVLAHHRLAQASRKSVEGWERYHKAFHTELLIACGSPILMRFCEQLYDLNIRYRYIAGQSGNYARRSVSSEHREIFEATIERDQSKASALLMQHYRRTGEFLVDRFS